MSFDSRGFALPGVAFPRPAETLFLPRRAALPPTEVSRDTHRARVERRLDAVARRPVGAGDLARPRGQGVDGRDVRGPDDPLGVARDPAPRGRRAAAVPGVPDARALQPAERARPRRVRLP